MSDVSTRKVLCRVAWRRRGKEADKHGSAPAVDTFLLPVDVSAELKDGVQYENRYIDEPWREALIAVSAHHGIHQNFFEITSIEPVCDCLGPCKYGEGLRFDVKEYAVGGFDAALFEREKDGGEAVLIAAGSDEDMLLLLRRRRRINHHK